MSSLIFRLAMIHGMLASTTILPTITPHEISNQYLAVGNSLQQQGIHGKALNAYRNALRFNHENLLATFNCGIVLYSQKKYEQALDYFNTAISIDKKRAQPHYNAALCLCELKEFHRAVEYLNQALALHPDYEKAHVQLGFAYEQIKDSESAIKSYKQALRLNPQNAEVYRSLGKLLVATEQLTESLEYFEQSLRLNPHHLATQFDLANTLNMLNRMEEALELYKLMAENHPTIPELTYNYAYALKKTGHIHQAIELYKKALILKPEYSNAHFSLGLAYLALGEFSLGWPEYEWRWKAYNEAPKKFVQPAWDGSSLTGKRILVYAEQGLGDTFQFIRYVKLLKEQGATVIFQTQKPLKTILSLCPYIDELIVQGQQPLPAFDTHIALMSLPLIMGTEATTVPHEIPYLYADQKLVDEWEKLLSHDKNIKIGICWQGNAQYSTQSLRHTVAAKSMKISSFAPLTRIPGVSFYSLQKVNGEDQLNNLPDGFFVHSFTNDFDESHGRFMDTAALIKNLDLVITIDTSISHFAAALGAPVWLLLPEPADWRWMINRNDTPWYPNMRLFRQPSMGAWEDLIEIVYAALQEYVSTLSV